MLEIDYELRRQEGNGHDRVFNVDKGLETINSNAVYIQAPNAKGKSTFLNILALALYGNKLDEADSRISESLRSDIRYMAGRKNQNYIFDVKITSKDGSIQLISTKNDCISDDIDVKEIIDGKERRLPLSVFKDEYFLIYDIPEDPLNRITEILSEIKTQQIRYKNKVADFKRYLNAIKQEIAQSRDDKEIEKIKKSVFDYKEKDAKLNDIITKESADIKIIEIYLSLREFKNYVEISSQYLDSLDRISKKKMNHGKKSRRFNTQYDNKKNDVLSKLSDTKHNISAVTSRIDNLFIDRNYNEITKHIETIRSSELCKGKSDINKEILSEINYFHKEINDFLTDRNVKESGKKGSFYKTLIDTLEQYQSADIPIPGVDKGIDEIILLLKEEYANNSNYKMIFDDLRDCIQKLKFIELELGQISKDLESLRVLHRKRDETSKIQIDKNEIYSEIDEIETDLERCLRKIDKYKEISHKHGHMIDESSIPGEINELTKNIREQHKDFVQIFRLDEKSILSEIESREVKLDEYKRKHSNNFDILKQHQEKLKSLENRKPHKYHRQSAEINRLSNVIESLDQNLIDYNRIVREIADGSTRLTSEIDNKYNEEISQYFAEKIPEFPYIDEFVKPEKIDFLNKVIILNGGREIDMKDISTGQSMSMYIQALLNRPKDDERKMVVIFDEGATMDSNSFKPIKQILKKHIDQNKVLFAVFAKAIDGELEITNLI